MTEEEDLGGRLEATVKAGSPAEVAAIGADIDRYVFDHATFPARLFSRVLSVIGSADFCHLAESVGVIKLFEYNLDLLSEAQREQLVSVLAGTISKLADSVCAFLAVELIAEVWRDRRSFDLLMPLSSAGSADTVALAVHGLDWLAKKTIDEDVRARCLEQLRLLGKHSSRLVQAEAIAALRRRTQARP